MSTEAQIALGVVGFFALLALLTFMRLALRRQPPAWTRLRLGFFVEREPVDDDKTLPPTTYRRISPIDDEREE